MNIFYNAMPLPLFILITFVVPIAILIHFIKNSSNYPRTALVGIFFLSLSSFSAGIVRLIRELNVLSDYHEELGFIPIPAVLGVVLFILIGAYQKVKHNRVERNKIIMALVILFLIVSYVVFLGIFKPWEN